MAVTLQDQNKLENAIETYKKVLVFKPDHAESYINIGVVLQAQGKIQKAIEAYNNALSINPNDAEVYNNMGLAFKEQGKLEEAIEAFTKALSIKPDHAGARGHRGLCQRERGYSPRRLRGHELGLGGQARDRGLSERCRWQLHLPWVLEGGDGHADRDRRRVDWRGYALARPRKFGRFRGSLLLASLGAFRDREPRQPRRAARHWGDAVRRRAQAQAGHGRARARHGRDLGLPMTRDHDTDQTQHSCRRRRCR